jgi:superfamily II DNA or RNA helicase
MGAGKTIITLLAIAATYEWYNSDNFPKPGRIHIAVPTHLAASRWIEDLNIVPALADQFQYVRSSKQLRNVAKPIIIYSHDLPKCKSKGWKENVKYMKKFLRPSFFCIDEVHNVKPNTQRTKTLEQLRLVSKRCIGLTGTLSDGELNSISHLCKFIYQDYFPYDPKSFSREFGINRRLNTTYKGESIDEEDSRYLRHLDQSKLPKYYTLMRNFCHRVTLDDPEVRPYISFPEPKEESELIEPSKEQQQQHQHYIQQRREQLSNLAEGEHDSSIILRILHPLILTANAPEGSSPKLERTKEEVEQSKEKVVLFTSSVSSNRKIYNYLTENGIKSVRVYSEDPQGNPPSMSEDSREKKIREFQNTEEITCCVIQIHLASEAFDLQNAGMVVFYDLPWSSLKVKQATARVVRPGNRRKQVRILFPHSRGLIDNHQFNLIKSKIEVSDMLFDFQTKQSKQDKVETTDVIQEILTNG